MEKQEGLMTDRWRNLLVLALLLGLGLRLWLAFQPIEVLIQKVLVDDAFYYLQLAKRTVWDGLVSFDGLHRTNGFHPLWLILLLPFFGFARGNLVVPVHGALVLLGLFSVAAGYVAYLTLRQLTANPKAGVIAGCLWLLNPLICFSSLCGVEAALYVFLLAFWVYAYVRTAQRGITSGRAFLLGLGLGAVILSRTDGIFLFLAAAADIWWRNRGERFRLLSLFSLGCFLALSPWLFWNLYHFGTIRQISGRVIPFTQHSRFLAKGNQGWKTVVVQLAWMVLRGGATLLFFAGFGDLILNPWGMGLALVALVWICLLLRRNTPQKLYRLNFLLLYSLLLFSYYTLYHWYVNFRYFLPLAYILSIYLACGVEVAVRRWPWLAEGLVVFFAGIYLFSGMLFFQHGRAPHQWQNYQAAQYLNRLKTRPKIGAWNAGIVGYFYQGTTVNLDGVVNNPLWPYLKTHRLLDYIRREGIEYVGDSRQTFEEWAWALGGKLEEVLEPVYQLTPVGITSPFWRQLAWSSERLISPWLLYRTKPKSNPEH